MNSMKESKLHNSSVCEYYILALIITFINLILFDVKKNFGPLLKSSNVTR